MARDAQTQFNIAKFAKGALIVLVVLLLGYGMNAVDFESWALWIRFSNSPFASWYQGKVSYFLVGFLFTLVGGPRQVVAFFAAYFFGFWPGFILGMLATSASSLAAALLARLFEDNVRRLVRGRVDIVFQLWRDNPLSTTIILRLLPVGSNLLTNLAAGSGGVPLGAFLAGSAIGYVPQMLIFSLMGSGVEMGGNAQIVFSIALFAVLSVISYWLYERYRRRLKSLRNGG